MKPGGENIHLSRDAPDIAAEAACSGTIECALAGVADHLMLLLWFALLVIVALASLTFLPRAQRLCERERHRATVEYDAFDEFLARVRSFQTSGSATATSEPVGAGGLMQQQVAAQLDGLAKVRDAYRETVMAVPHFEEDYDESLIEHMSAELGEELAHAAVEGGPLVQPIKQGLLEAARDARDRRADFIELLDEEDESLRRHQRDYEDIARRVERSVTPRCADETYNGLQRRRRRLNACAADIESTIEERQRDRTEGKTATIQMMDGADLQEYLYRPMDVTYPVLAEGTKLLSQIEVGIRRIEDELIYRS